MHQNELNSELERLYVHFWEGTITDLEMSRLQDLLAASPERRAEFKELQALALLVERRADADKFDVRSALLKVKGKLRRRRVEIFRRWVYAAGVAILIGIGSVLLWIGKPEEKSLPLPVSQTLLAEKGGGMGKVFLEVGEDRQIELQPDTLKSVIHLYADVAEEEKLSEMDLEPQWRRLFTQEGANYSVVLADGTKVWLNADSELGYPDYFTGKKREVYLKGEAYFEVAKDTAHPFHVNMEGMEVVVLGTAFNIKNYENEAEINVTLVNGGVKIMKGVVRELARLLPLQVFEMDRQTSAYRVGQTDLRTALAWRNNMFIFDKCPLENILKQVSHWYGVKFDLDGRLADAIYSGNISRSEPLEQVLNILSLTNEITFMVMPETNVIKVSLKE